jgi:phosphinothricin acetyltransferase
MMQIRAAEIKDLPALTEIYNEAIRNTTATFDTEEKTVENRREWFLQHSHKYPVLVAEEEGEVTGWASLSRWSDRCAYDDTAEISIYIHPSHRGRGVGKALTQAVVDAGRKGGLHCVLSRITQGNAASVHLHEQNGFTHVGTMREVGKKFEKVLDVHIMQLIYPATGE